MSTHWRFTSESVTEGPPDKMADQISDSILDAILAKDPKGRVACETLLTTGLVVVAGEITTEAYVDMAKIARETICSIGYDRESYGFDGHTCGVVVSIDEQSSNIAQGVDSALERRTGSGDSALDAAITRIAPDHSAERADTPDSYVTALRRIPAVSGSAWAT